MDTVTRKIENMVKKTADTSGCQDTKQDLDILKQLFNKLNTVPSKWIVK